MSHLDFSRHHRLNHPRASADANDLDIQPLLFKSFGALGNERRGLRAAELQMNEAKFLELLLRDRARSEAQNGANKKQREWFLGFHLGYFVFAFRIILRTSSVVRTRAMRGKISSIKVS
jgi:hypothetical protein